MIGYIYKTTNLINGRVYIGKHCVSEYDPTYYGSGKLLKKAIKKYGKENFKNELLLEAETESQLNELEKKTIREYREMFGRKLYNIAEGGNGGDTISGLSEQERDAFVQKMTQINQKRCASAEFKRKISQANKRRYSDPAERKRHSEKVKKTWSDPELRKRHGEYIHNYFLTHKKDGSYMFKPCCLEYNGIVKHFDSLKALKQYMSDVYDFRPGHWELHKLLEQGKQRIPYKPYHKNKFANIIGLIIYNVDKESVETSRDECSDVGLEISTSSKCETK